MIPNITKFKLSFSFAVKALAANKFRAMLTALGIIFGVAAVISMLAIGNGAEQEIMEQIKKVGSNNIIVQKKLPTKNDDESGRKKEIITSTGLTINDMQGIEESLPGLHQLSPELAYESFVTYRERSSNLRLVGVNEHYFSMFNYVLREGQFFSNVHVERSSPVCVIGQSAKKKLFANDNPIGQSIKCGRAWFEVIGVINTTEKGEGESEIMGVRDADDDIYMPITSMLLRYKNKNLVTKKTIETSNNEDSEESEGKEEQVDYHQIDKIIIQVEKTELLRDIAAVVSKYLYRVHGKTFDFEIHIPELLLKQQQRSKAIFNIVLGVIAGISLLVGGIGIMNIMLASVMERIKEIGVRMAIGASEKDIVLQFVLESVLLSVSGGVAGIVLGLIITTVIEMATGILTIVTLFSVILSFGVSVIIGIIFGIMPAKRAAKQDPVVSLRN